MTKPTLNDFYKDPRKAYRNGFRLTWKHSILHVIKCTFVDVWLDIFKLFVGIIVAHLIPILFIILCILAILLIIITMPIFFPFWVVSHQLSTRKVIKKYFERSDDD